MKLSLCLAAAAAFAAVACKTGGTSALRDAGAAANDSSGSTSDEAMQLWTTYVARVDDQAKALGRTLQPDCEPRFAAHRTTADDGTAVGYRGVAMLFHGFSACPQQFGDMITLLTAAGFDVFAPLLPGHGYARDENNFGTNWFQSEFVTQLPDGSSIGQYATFVDEMTALVQASGAPQRVVAGLSLGGSMAMQATLSGVYTRSLIFAPFFDGDPSGPVPTLLKEALRPAWVPLVLGGGPNTYIGWDGPLGAFAIGEFVTGQGKHICRDSPGRAGYCAWQIKHLAGVADYGESVVAKARQTSGVAVQFVAAQKEGAISFPKLFSVYHAVGGSDAQAPNDGGPVHGCELITRHGTSQIPHPFFAKTDNWPVISDAERAAAAASPDAVIYPAKMYWLRPFLTQTVRFAAFGTPFDAQPTPSGDPDPDAPFYACSAPG